MCYNCGCGVPNDDMGKGKVTQNGDSLTEDDLKEMSTKWGMNLTDTKQNIYDLLGDELKKK